MSFVRQANDVINFIYWLGKPAVIKEAEIRHIRHFTNTYADIRIEKTAVNINAVVRAINEPSTEDGEDVIVVLKTINIKLSLPSLGFILVANTEKANSIFDYDYDSAKMVS